MLIDVHHLSYTYPDGQQALKDISFSIQSGQTVGLIGENGAGKSTLFHVLLGLAVPDSGQAVIAGCSLEKNNYACIRQKMGMVFQNPDDQLFMTTVEEDILFEPRNSGASEEQCAALLERVMGSLGITHLKGRLSHTLSGGEKRLVAIASVLACEPEILLFDEPLSFLDPRARSVTMDILASIPETKIIATHDLDMASQLCDRIFVMQQGRLMKTGGPEILVDEAFLKSVGLELPVSLQRCKNCDKYLEE